MLKRVSDIDQEIRARYPSRKLEEAEWLCAQIESSARRRAVLRRAQATGMDLGEVTGLIGQHQRQQMLRCTRAAVLLASALPHGRRRDGMRLARLYYRAQRAHITAALLEACGADDSPARYKASEYERQAAQHRESLLQRAAEGLGV